MKGIVTSLLNNRFDGPSVNAIVIQVLIIGEDLQITDTVKGDTYENNDIWFKLIDSSYVWSGAVRVNGSGNHTEVVNNTFSTSNLTDEWVKEIGYNKKSLEELLPFIGEVLIDGVKAGSCCYLSNNRILSCWHIFKDQRSKIQVNFSGKFYSVSIAKEEINASFDLALLRLRDKVGPILEDIPIGKDELILNEASVCNIGFPSSSNGKSISFGKVLPVWNNYYSHSCYSKDGNSGGAIINLETKKLIGIHKGEKPINSGKFIFRSIEEFKDILDITNINI